MFAYVKCEDYLLLYSEKCWWWYFLCKIFFNSYSTLECLCDSAASSTYIDMKVNMRMDEGKLIWIWRQKHVVWSSNMMLYGNIDAASLIISRTISHNLQSQRFITIRFMCNFFPAVFLFEFSNFLNFRISKLKKNKK